jgi:hypothetical protein
VAHGEQGGGEELTVRPSGQLPEVCENYTHRGAGSILCQTLLDLAVIAAARLAACTLKSQGEWRDTGLGYAKLDFLQKHPFTLKQDGILKKYQLLKPFKVWIPTRQD